MTILLTGGAGYIGAITNKYLVEKGYKTVIFDNFITGHTESIEATPYVNGDICRKVDIEIIFQNYDIDGVIHFAARALAGESMIKPNLYYETNVLGMVNLLEVMQQNECFNIVFSSSCSVYGFPETLPVKEEMAYAPLSV